jgi:hypothetical protein
MPRSTRVLVSVALIMGLATVVPVASEPPAARAITPARFVSGWIPNWSSAVVTDGLGALTQGYGALFADLSPFGFSAIGPADIVTSGSESTLSAAVTAARANHIPVIPTITDGTGRLIMAGILADDAQRAQHVAAITNLVVSRGYDGIDLDYEGFAFNDGQSSWAATRPNWARFVIELGASLHGNGKLLSVTVPPMWDGGSSGYWVYSWHDRNPQLDILPAVDRLRLMVYDWSVGKAGPVSPMSWVNNVLAFVKSAVPADQLRKVQMGVPTYGRSWASVISGSCPSGTSLATVGVQMENVGSLLAKPGASVQRDPSGEMKLVYDDVFTGSGTSAPPPPYVPPPNRSTEVAAANSGGLSTAVRLGGATCTVRRTVYYPDDTTVVQHAQAAVAAGVSGVVFWAMGYETDTLWQHLAGIDAPRPTGSTPIGSLDVAQSLPGSVRVAGWLMDPEVDLPITFTVSVNGGVSSGPLLARDIRTDVAQAVPGADPMHGFDVVVPVATPPGANVCVTASGFGSGVTPTSICRAAS